VGDETNSAILERAFLQSLCALDGPGRREANLALKLANYIWCDPDNQIVFEALNRLSCKLTAPQLRDQLPAQVTRMGFPVIIWENYLPTDRTVDQNIHLIIDQLLAAHQSRKI